MRYDEVVTLSSTPLSGSPILAESSRTFAPWQPSTWPETPDAFNDDFFRTLEIIFKATIINEVDNVISDARGQNGSLEHRGHVIAIAQLCAIDTLASYLFFDGSAETCAECGFKDSKIHGYTSYISEFFPDRYKPYSRNLYKEYRNTMVHSWNLFKTGVSPGEEDITENNGVLSYGILNFQYALRKSLEDALGKLRVDPKLQESVVGRYGELKRSARS